MKILVIPEYDLFGGTLSFLKRLLEIHKKNGIETAVLIEEGQQFPDVMMMFQKHGVRVYTGTERQAGLPLPFSAHLSDVMFSWKAYRSFSPDLIVVSNGTPGKMSGVLLLPVPVLFVMHTYPRVEMSFSDRLYFGLASRWRNRFMSVSRFAAVAMNRCLGIPQERIEVVYNSFRPTLPKTNDRRPMVLTVGHVEWYKNPECWLNVALQVVSRRPDVRFVWLGDGELLEPMREKVRTMGGAGRIELPGYSDQVASYYAEAMVYFQPSLVENHGISVVEAMAHGLPCITSDVGGMPESVVNGETGFTCPPHDVEGFVERIVELLENQELSGKMGAAGRNRAETLFTEAVQEEKILQIYAKMGRR